MKLLLPINLRKYFGDWASEYIKKYNALEAKKTTAFKKRTVKDLEKVVRKIKAKGRTRLYKAEVEYITLRIIPYVQRTGHYPQSYRNVIAVIKEVLDV